ncbi:DUF1656 domain-containing protein [Aurantimonas sp. VKM B-3413]|uniref:DUF1656 domain-containing protein n=1 Tax=Aurantimonas sp. VKM B-3413 TaxID=2779401 RepID=UPI001E5A8AFD|nr:DUF1656 domain-containing protein [Aurantimonas sp. VKM B-3413]MCB8837408.1 DUF1656 domain-containing protein [Aurantimonas sp. VKM B-3413]
MLGDFAFFGVYLPKLLVLALLAYGCLVPMKAVLGRLGLYRAVWHPPLFDLALYVLVLAGLADVSSWYLS